MRHVHYMYNNSPIRLQTSQVHTNHNASCDYTYTVFSEKQKALEPSQILREMVD
jgi:hypothetical protein